MPENVWDGCGTTNNREGSCVEITADIVRYVNKVDTDSGWLLAREGKSTALVALCKYTKVILLGTKKQRTYFKVSDGPLAGRILNMSDVNAKEYLGNKAPVKQGAELVVTYGKYDEKWYSIARQQALKQQLAIAEVGGIAVQVAMNSVWKESGPEWKNFAPIAPGEYTILIPDTPHNKNMTGFYKRTEPSLSHHQVWFPIKLGDNSRYVHVGNVSDGCTTVLDIAKWADIHEALISHRSADGKSIGVMIVKGKPERVE